MSIHKGHRQRLKKQFLHSGFDGFSEVQKLELVLCYSIPQGDVNPLAHALLDRFGSYHGVFDAPFEELKKVPGIGEHTATHLKLITQFNKAYLTSRTQMIDILDAVEKAGEYLVPRFYGERDEVVYMICLDAKYKVLGCKKIFHGSVNSASIDTRKIVEMALLYNASCVIIAHNHTSGIALPSDDDKVTTRKIEEALRSVHVVLSDHIIVADDDFVSMADNGFFRRG